MPDLHPTVRLDTDELPSGPWIYGRNVGPLADISHDDNVIRPGMSDGHAQQGGYRQQASFHLPRPP